MKQQCFCLQANVIWAGFGSYKHLGMLFGTEEYHRFTDLLAGIESHKLVVFKTVLCIQSFSFQDHKDQNE